MDQAVIFERGEYIYLVGALAPITPSDTEIDELAFTSQVKSYAPNENLVWLRGQYVEADRANRNGQQWTAGDLAIASLTPRLMPITVNHDPRTAVGLIADAKLLTPDKDQVPRSRIDTYLALWGHRFPDVMEEALENYKRGELTQSMECRPGYYDCADCGKSYVPLPDQAERKNWCEHLRAENASGPRRLLRDVTFTGTGMLFGTRGVRPALDSAHLEVFQDEVAEFHQRGHEQRHRRPSRMDKIEIDRNEYDRLKAEAAKVADLEIAAAKVPDLERKLADSEKENETLETAKVAVEKERDDEKAKVTLFEETGRQSTLATERVGKLGNGFTERLGEKTKKRLDEQAKTLSDEDWAARLDELSELVDVKPDAETNGSGGSGGGSNTFTREELASTAAGASGGATPPRGNAPTADERRSTIAGLRRKPTPAGKS